MFDQEKFLDACDEENIQAMVDLIGSIESTQLRVSINIDDK